MNRRQFLGCAFGAGAVVATVRFATTPAAAAPPHGGHGPGDMVERTPEGWESHLLPFAKPFPTQAAVEAELARSRQLQLFR